MNWMQIINTIVSYVWLGGSLWFFWRILVTLEKWLKPISTLADVSAKNAASTEQSVKATQNAIDLLNEVLHGHP